MTTRTQYLQHQHSSALSTPTATLKLQHRGGGGERFEQMRAARCVQQRGMMEEGAPSNKESCSRLVLPRNETEVANLRTRAQSACNNEINHTRSSRNGTRTRHKKIGQSCKSWGSQFEAPVAKSVLHALQDRSLAYSYFILRSVHVSKLRHLGLPCTWHLLVSFSRDALFQGCPWVRSYLTGQVDPRKN